MESHRAQASTVAYKRGSFHQSVRYCTSAETPLRVTRLHYDERQHRLLTYSPNHKRDWFIAYIGIQTSPNISKSRLLKQTGQLVQEQLERKATWVVNGMYILDLSYSHTRKDYKAYNCQLSSIADSALICCRLSGSFRGCQPDLMLKPALNTVTWGLSTNLSCTYSNSRDLGESNFFIARVTQIWSNSTRHPWRSQ